MWSARRSAIRVSISAASAQQARSAWTTLRSFAAFLAERGVHHTAGESTLRLVRPPKVKDDIRRALTDAGNLTDRAESGEQAPRDRTIVVTLLGTGLRVGELVGLQLSDIDLGERVLRVRASTSKSVNPREIALPVEVVKERHRYVRVCARTQSKPILKRAADKRPTRVRGGQQAVS